MLLMVLEVFSAPSGATTFGGLADRLVRDGYDTSRIQSLYGDPRCEFLPEIARINLKHEEDTAAYRMFLEEQNLSLARDYLARHRALLERFERQSHVPPEIVVAILLIETKCGRDRDKAPVLNVLSTIAISAEDRRVEKSFEGLKMLYPELTLSDVRRRARRRSRWAYKELRAFIDWHARHERHDLHGIRGSWAGALGLPQFMPTALAAYGVDGDGDGRVDLHTDTDTVASVCNYLRRNGWKPGRPPREQRKVIWRYNHSPLYVDTVLDVAERISE